VDGHSTNNNAVDSLFMKGENTNAGPINRTTNGTTNGTTTPISGISIPIAICGMAIRLPGGLSTPQQFWEFLLAKGDGRCRVPESRYNVSSFYSSDRKPGTTNTEYGYSWTK